MVITHEIIINWFYLNVQESSKLILKNYTYSVW